MCIYIYIYIYIIFSINKHIYLRILIEKINVYKSIIEQKTNLNLYNIQNKFNACYLYIRMYSQHIVLIYIKMNIERKLYFCDA
jgi:hypothetical protein